MFRNAKKYKKQISISWVSYNEKIFLKIHTKLEKRIIQLPFAKCKSMIYCLPSDMNSLLFEPHMILQNALKICKIYLSGTQNNVLCHPFIKLPMIIIHINLHDINKHPFVPYSNFVMTDYYDFWQIYYKNTFWSHP